MYKRFFAFGCSFTSYYWPTWADILGREFGNNFYNLGMCGAGNEFIFHKLIESNERYNFNSDDLIIICWSNFAREDRYKNRRWMRSGDMSQQTRYSEEWVEKYFDIRGFFLKSSNLIAGTTHILNQFGCEYLYTSMCKMLHVTQFEKNILDKENEDIFNLYQNYYTKIKISMVEHLYGLDFAQNPHAAKIRFNSTDLITRFDHHPTPEQHSKYLNDIILPSLKYNISISDVTKKWVDDWEHYIFMANPFILAHDGWSVEDRIEKWHKNMF